MLLVAEHEGSLLGGTARKGLAEDFRGERQTPLPPAVLGISPPMPGLSALELLSR
jgi:hypothetical protein